MSRCPEDACLGGSILGSHVKNIIKGCRAHNIPVSQGVRDYTFRKGAWTDKGDLDFVGTKDDFLLGISSYCSHKLVLASQAFANYMNNPVISDLPFGKWAADAKFSALLSKINFAAIEIARARKEDAEAQAIPDTNVPQ